MATEKNNSKNDIEDEAAYQQLYINELKEKVKKKLEETDPSVMKAFKIFMEDETDTKK